MNLLTAHRMDEECLKRPDKDVSFDKEWRRSPALNVGMNWLTAFRGRLFASSSAATDGRTSTTRTAIPDDSLRPPLAPSPEHGDGTWLGTVFGLLSAESTLSKDDRLASVLLPRRVSQAEFTGLPQEGLGKAMLCKLRFDPALLKVGRTSPSAPTNTRQTSSRTLAPASCFRSVLA